MLSKKERKKSIDKLRSMRLFAVLLVPVVALIMGAYAPDVWAQPECWWNIEFNATDLDVGVRGFFDDDPWQELEIENPRGRTIAEVEAKRSLRRQGYAEWFFESGEPPLDEVSFKTFLRRFKEGDYEFEAELNDGGEVECIAEFTHVIPCPPVIISNPFEDGVISWNPVTMVVDTEATDENVADGIEGIAAVVCVDDDLVIEGYEVIVEGENGDLSITLPAEATDFEVPPELGDFDKFEVLAIEESGNQTITEVTDE